jgi:signal transduction histidine kinase
MVLINGFTGEAPWERRLRAGNRWLPHLLLAMSATLAILTEINGYRGAAVLLAALLVAAGAVGWTQAFASTTAGEPGRAATYYAGRTVFAGVLVALNPWFALFAFLGYADAIRLFRPRPAIPGIVATAAIVAWSQTGGVPTSGYAVYFVVLVVNAGLASLVAVGGTRLLTQADEHRRLIAELQATNERLEAVLAENSGLHDQLIAQAREAGVLDERQRLAAEIHDTLAQGLAGIITQLEAAAGGVDRERHLAAAGALARVSLREARLTVQDLRPDLLARRTLEAAIAQVARDWSERTGIPTEVAATGAAIALGADAEVALFRTAQEALTNIGKHAAAQRVGVTLTFLDELVLLDIRDDGLGFAPGVSLPSPDGTGVGLIAMRQRLERVGGGLAIESAPGCGTALSARVPVPTGGSMTKASR